ncbi:MAG: hypothetical protein KAT12_03425 [Gammaproteobacteria bacterium]|nr:hypothetical protein [Gammaproteobacteria bacterium]
MSTALFFITHEGIASNLIRTGEAIIKKKNNNLSYAEIPMDADVDSMIENIENELRHLDLEEGVIFITDIYGSTPSNIAQLVTGRYDAELISGVNLPMIMRLLNYRDSPIKTLVQKALDGAVQGIQLNNPGT